MQMELKAQESIVRGQVGWSQQSSESSLPLTISGAYDSADFTDGLAELEQAVEKVAPDMTSSLSKTHGLP